MIHIRTSKRQRHHLPEVAFSRGPLGEEGVTGDGSYLALFGSNWALVQHQGDKLLHLYQAEPGPEWADRGIIPIPHQGREIRHISLCFDQAARPVVAYERQHDVWVRQWDAGLGQYVMRGPYPGVDPVLIQDAEVNFYSPDSDVLLFYLSRDRRSLQMRVQRETFAVERTIETYPTERILDQGISLPYQWELLGDGITIRSDTYPAYLPINDLTTITGQAPTTGNYRALVVVRDVGTDQLTTITGQAPTTGNYALKVIVVDLGNPDILSTVMASAPTTGTYGTP